MHSQPETTESVSCPICNKDYLKDVIEEHVNKCLFLNTTEQNRTSKRTSSQLDVSGENVGPSNAKRKSPIINFGDRGTILITKNKECKEESLNRKLSISKNDKNKDIKETKPLAEAMRPIDIDDIVGQEQAFGRGSMLRSLLEQRKVPNMILWGPPGCGKTSLANVVANICKEQGSSMRFVKLSATMSGISDVKEVVKVAKNEAQFKRQTILFMDEIHRFNKLQQDTFLPHVENGTITLIGATTENPSFSLNNALLSRCRVVIMEKLSVDNVMKILRKAIKKNKDTIIVSNERGDQNESAIPRCIIEESCLQWLSEVCDGDARVALGALELALASQDAHRDVAVSGPATLTLDHIKDGIKRSHMLYDRKGDEHYNIISALQKSIRASDDNAALYWTTRALHGGEDPLYIARRLVRTACEDIGLADQNALVEAVACYQGCQSIGMSECDVLLAQCAVRLARAPKSRSVYNAMKRCQQALAETKGPLPPVPLHLRNAPTKLMKQLGYSKGYNIMHRDDSGLNYMPDGMEEVSFFHPAENCRD